MGWSSWQPLGIHNHPYSIPSSFVPGHPEPFPRSCIPKKQNSKTIQQSVKTHTQSLSLSIYNMYIYVYVYMYRKISFVHSIQSLLLFLVCVWFRLAISNNKINNNEHMICLQSSMLHVMCACFGFWGFCCSAIVMLVYMFEFATLQRFGGWELLTTKGNVDRIPSKIISPKMQYKH